MRSTVPRSDIIASYKCQISALRKKGIELNLRGDEVDKLLAASLDIPNPSHPGLGIISNVKNFFHSSVIPLTLSLAILIFSITVYILISFHKPSYNVVARNIQDFIHPMMRILRYASLPLVRNYPGATAVYDESCLIENPFFNYRDVDCWPCTNVYSPIDLSDYVDDPKSRQPHSAYPFFMKDVSPEVTYANLQAMYWKQAKMFNRDAYKIVSSVNSWTRISHVLSYDLSDNPTLKEDAHITWRINRIEATRPIRHLFKRPKFIPPSVTLERFILIDEPRSPAYEMPQMESFNVFIMQGSGERLLVLEPVYSCHRHCSTIAIHMRQAHFLFYSNLYYTLKSYPVKQSRNISVTYVGAY